MKRIFLLLVLLISVTSCKDKQADVESPLSYSKYGISFDYPSNWNIQESDSENGNINLSIKTSTDAIFILLLLKDLESSLLLIDLAQNFSSLFSDQLKIGEITEEDFKGIDGVVSGVLVKGVREGFNIELLGQGVPHYRDYFKAEQGKDHVVFISQTLVEKADMVEAGFELIRNTFRFNVID